MRDPELALVTAYNICLEGKIKADGVVVPVHVKGVPSTTEAPYICISEVSITPDMGLRGFTAYICSVLLDIVVKFDNELYEFSKATRIGSLCMELLDGRDLNAVINGGVLTNSVEPTGVDLVEPSGETDNQTILWEVTKNDLASSINMTEDTETRLVSRRLIRFDTKIFLKT